MSATSELPSAVIDELLVAAEPDEPQETGRATCSIVFFDLTGSTARKLAEGHRAGVMAAVKHNNFCRLVAEEFDGDVLKELGDGVLAMFADPLKAVLAAETVRSGLMGTELSTKVGMTFGMVDVVEVEGRRDVLGAIVDRAARIQSAALPDQILVDGTQVDAISDYLADHSHIRLGSEIIVPLRGVGDVKLWPIESATAEVGQPRLPERLRVYGNGRLPTADKLRFMSYATQEVIEFGTGLITFVSYFDSLGPSEWRNPVVEMLQRGVDIRCFVLDPDSRAAQVYFELRNEGAYRDRASGALDRLLDIRDELNGESGSGQVSVLLYESLPAQYALAVDLDRERSAMQFSPYLPGLRRAECPVYEASRTGEPELFGRLQVSLENQMNEAALLD
jgi:class 3 adenylate cyclase